jgi:hypothetical protein
MGVITVVASTIVDTLWLSAMHASTELAYVPVVLTTARSPRITSTFSANAHARFVLLVNPIVCANRLEAFPVDGQVTLTVRGAEFPPASHPDCAEHLTLTP